MSEILMYMALLIIWGLVLYHIFLMYGGLILSLRDMEKLSYNNYSSHPMVTILIPAHNEEVVIEETIKSMINLIYPKEKLEVIIINDNSSDDTGRIIESYSSQYSYIKLVQTTPPFAGKGKSIALNQGLKQSSGEIIIVYDADNMPEPEAVQNLVLVLQDNEKVGVSIGKFRVINAGKNLLTQFIDIETIAFQWIAQAGRWFWFKLSTIPGTNFAIRRSILEMLGGWDERALSEDTELSIRVYNLGYYIKFCPEAVTWEQEPESLRVWWKQRIRWARGNIYVIVKYLLKFNKLSNKRVIIDFIYFLCTYFMFISSIFVSHSILVINIFIDLELKVGYVSNILLLLGFLLFVTEALLAISIEKKTLTLKNILIVLLMYFTYSQFWLLIVVKSFYLEIKRKILNQEIIWYKTKRFKKNEI